MNESSPEWLSRKSAATLIDVHPRTIDVFVREGRLARSFYVGKSPRFAREAVLALLTPAQP